ncbi:hypothetical protein MKZ38_007818 [Zalerion maritima]|uniref:Cenp-O kinetochore centromere component n=1 Tax=Zalerion maritima TaxID=339359 RepID=A0AAD5RI53_9PEZI|nr:hypothetical protein MKZ38_007818 [Zalerion maritima]
MSPPEPEAIAESLDAEITSLRTHLQSLKRQLSLHTSTLLSSSILPSLLEHASDAPPTKSRTTAPSTTLDEASTNQLKKRIAAQRAHNTQSLYRSVAGITTFRISDPDPRAVDGGRVLGVRIEAPSSSARGGNEGGVRFVRPYYVLLNRPWGNVTPGDGDADQDGNRSAERVHEEEGEEEEKEARERRKQHLRIHKHTVPPCIPLDALAAKWLPAPGRKKRQNLPQFCRSLRRDIIRYHHRVSIIADLKRLFGLRPSHAQGGMGARKGLGSGGGSEADVAITDDSTAVDQSGIQEEEGNNTVLNPDPLEHSSFGASLAVTLGGTGDAEQAALALAQERKKAKIIHVFPVDAEAKQIRIDWSDGRTGRLILDDDGNVAKMAVFEEGVRDRDTVREILLPLPPARGDGNNNGKRIEEVIGRLGEVRGR